MSRRRPRRRPSWRHPACRSRWCSAPSRAAKTSSSRSPPPTKPPPAAASRPLISGRCENDLAAGLWADIVGDMTKLLEQALEAVRRLPPESQDDIARAMLHLANGEAASEAVD